MGTWRLVEKPPDAIPLANKWMFIRKWNKAGKIVKHKVRLVVKGCAQQPGYDYVETFSPVVRMETIRAILALVPIKGLKVQQMDVKGAYLNGILKEKVYMHQLEGYEDGTGRVCELIKTLYGLKQSGQEWNKELDEKLKKFGFQRLHSDPCVYIKRDGNDVTIITVWVDDLLLIAKPDELMEQTKSDLHTEWEMTDLGEPTKIIGVEITQTKDLITLSQKVYIESILECEGLSAAYLVIPYCYRQTSGGCKLAIVDRAGGLSSCSHKALLKTDEWMSGIQGRVILLSWISGPTLLSIVCTRKI